MIHKALFKIKTEEMQFFFASSEKKPLKRACDGAHVLSNQIAPLRLKSGQFIANQIGEICHSYDYISNRELLCSNYVEICYYNLHSLPLED